MFACLHALTPGRSRLVEVAQSFTPRFEVVGALVMLDVRGVSRIFGEAQELGRHLEVAVREAVPDGRVARAATQTTAALLALGRPGLTLAAPGEEASGLASLPLGVLGAYEHLRIDAGPGDGHCPPSGAPAGKPEERATGWQHPRDTHQAQHTRPPRRVVTAAARMRDGAGVEDALRVLSRWGIHTLGALSALPSDDLSERLGPRGVRWQRLARGEDARPLVPWVEAPAYEAALDLEWPIEGLEPLSFVLGRLLEPLTARLEREDRGAVVLYTRLRLVSRVSHTRVLQLPAPMRDARALRTLLLLDLESHPPPAAIDQVSLALEPAPGRVVQEALFTRAIPAPEQVATLVARLTAVMGAGHVGTPSVVETWRPGAFTLRSTFNVSGARREEPFLSPSDEAEGALPGGFACAVRRYRLPVPARVRVVEGRPVRVMSDRHGVSGGAVMECAGPWRASGEWWCPSSYDRDEWDVAMADGTIYRIYVERAVGQWFIDGVID
jgi:protein ImuB